MFFFIHGLGSIFKFIMFLLLAVIKGYNMKMVFKKKQ